MNVAGALVEPGALEAAGGRVVPSGSALRGSATRRLDPGQGAR